MPHKKNPITGEKLCGLARVIRGNLVAGLENVALWHERDISHSSAERIIIPDSTIALDHMLTQLAKLVTNLRVFPITMRRNMEMTRGLLHSQQVLLLLTNKGFSREKAYRMVQRHAMRAWEGAGHLRELVARDPAIMARVTSADLDKVFDISTHFKDVARTFRAVGL